MNRSLLAVIFLSENLKILFNVKVVLPPCHSFDFEGRCSIFGLVKGN